MSRRCAGSFATLADSAIVAFELVNPPLSAGERERYYAEFRRFAAFFGIPQSAPPASWPAFAAYFEEMVGSDRLAVSPAARAIAAELFAGAGTRLRSPGWYRALTTGMLPERLRDEFALPYGPAEQRATRRARRGCCGSSIPASRLGCAMWRPTTRPAPGSPDIAGRGP